MLHRQNGIVRGSLWAAALAVSLCIASQAAAASLKVSPGRFIVHDVKPGIQYDIFKETGLRITIYNDDDVSRTWLLSTHRPSERGKWERGYNEIPDAHWCWFDQNEVTVEPKGKSYAHLFMQVPQEDKYLNRHWVVTIGVDGKPGPAGIALAADIRVQIETASTSDVYRSEARLGVAPSIVAFDNVKTGSVEKAQIVLVNNESRAQTFRIVPLFGEKGIEADTYLTHAYALLPDPTWLTFPSTVDAAPGAETVLPLELKLPNDPSLRGQKWESVLLIESEDGTSDFVRVRVASNTQAKTE